MTYTTRINFKSINKGLLYVLSVVTIVIFIFHVHDRSPFIIPVNEREWGGGTM